jgi:hypothetical protein
VHNGCCDAYVALGDDIVVFDELTSIRYLEILESFGVEVNLSKS